MIEAIPKSLFSSDFSLYREDRFVADLDVSSWRERAEVEVDGVAYRLYREGLVSGAFVMERSGGVIARAVKPSAFRDRFELDIAGRPYVLRKLSAWNRRFGLFEGDRQIGSVHPAGLFTRRTQIDLPGHWPSAAQVFIFWLALVVWNREDAAAAAT